MEHAINYGPLTCDGIGFILKTILSRGMTFIREQRFAFEAHAKVGYDGKNPDVFTDIDRDAQAMYVRLLREAFPDYGILAEEGGLNDVQDGQMYFTIDPIDGTKAFIRMQSHGIGTMIALVQDCRVIAAYVGDIMTGEIYGFRPESKRVHRIDEHTAKELVIDRERPLASQRILLTGTVERCAPALQNLIRGNIFDEYEIGSGSIGGLAARLWKGEVGALTLLSPHETPWDINPVMGICEKLGFVRIAINSESGRWNVKSPHVCRREVITVPQSFLVHSSRLNELDIIFRD
jgi:fructose-1,6-bisphosphatase/inositol monophosphatase family enzyme